MPVLRKNIVLFFADKGFVCIQQNPFPVMLLINRDCILSGIVDHREDFHFFHYLVT